MCILGGGLIFNIFILFASHDSYLYEVEWMKEIHLQLHVLLNPNKNPCNLFHDISKSNQEIEN